MPVISDNRIVDYYRWLKDNPSAGRRIAFVGSRRSKPMGGHFSLHYLTPLGEQVFALCREATGGRLPEHRGINKRGVYVKWAPRSANERADLIILADKLRDIGVEVEVVHMRGKVVDPNGTVGPDGTLALVSVDYIKLNLR